MLSVRALVISDTHFGAWTGEDILREPENLALLEPPLDGVDEVILLGDMFDFMFSSLREAFRASEGLMELLRSKLQGKRFVFLAGNHDHYFVRREAEELLGLELATGKSPQELQDDVRRTDFFRRILDQRLGRRRGRDLLPDVHVRGRAVHSWSLPGLPRPPQRDRARAAARTGAVGDRGGRRGALADSPATTRLRSRC